MPEIQRLPLFMAASLALLLAPGPAVLYIIARSLDQGWAAGLVSVLSIEVGNFIHVLAATLGLSALLVSSPVMFNIVKYLGAGYLIYLGLRKWLTKASIQAEASPLPQTKRQIFTQGVVVAVLNPKTALFFLAFLPQFVDSARPEIPLQMFVLGSIFVLMACVTDSVYAVLAGSARHFLRSSQRFVLVEKYFAGGVFLVLGLITLLEDVF